MAIFNLNWTPAGGVNSLNQTAKYKLNGAVTWLTTGFTPANPMNALVNTTQITGLLNNTIYQFQVDTNCSIGGPTSSPIVQRIGFDCLGGFSFIDNNNGTADISILGLNVYTSLNFVQFKVYSDIGALLETSANIPIGVPTVWQTDVLVPGDYEVALQYGSIVNGVQVFSNFGPSTCRYPFTIALV